MMQTLSQLEIAENFLNLIKKTSTECPTRFIALSGKCLNGFFPPKVRNEGGFSFSQLIFNTVLEVIGEQGKRRKEEKGRNGGERNLN